MRACMRACMCELQVITGTDELGDNVTMLQLRDPPYTLVFKRNAHSYHVYAFSLRHPSCELPFHLQDTDFPMLISCLRCQIELWWESEGKIRFSYDEVGEDVMCVWPHVSIFLGIHACILADIWILDICISKMSIRNHTTATSILYSYLHVTHTCFLCHLHVIRKYLFPMCRQCNAIRSRKMRSTTLPRCVSGMQSVKYDKERSKPLDCSRADFSLLVEYGEVDH